MKALIQNLLGRPALFAISIAISSTASAYLPVSAVTNLGITIYGMYTTSEATCQTGWSAVLPYNKNAIATNFATSGGVQLGNGSIANPTNCILLVIKNSGTISVSTGNYTGTTNGNANSGCNSGLSNTQTTFFGNSGSTSVVWPVAGQAPTTDMAAAGVTQVGSVASPTGNEVVPVYLSVNSACTANATTDAGNSTCVTNDNNGTVVPIAPPTTTGDTTHGYATVAPMTGQARYKFVIDFTNSMGGTGSSPFCGVGAAPPMRFVAF